ncbi:MAG: ribonuclease H-like domain-containing protein [Linnemannia elongata]|nr:MAG: ribonuclease H-like domain-containing protein [Linnemannia elongata]
MEIVRENFQRELPYIKEAIEECEFIAIDAEFSGLHTEPNRRTQNTTLEEGYEDLRKSASKFLTIQIGISTFKFDPTNGSYLAKPFNVFVFPTTLTGYSPQGRCFLTEASSLDFLAKNRFDFNKWVYQGVHYMTKDEEEIYTRERTKAVNNEMDNIAVDAANTLWLQDVIKRIGEWRNSKQALNFINIQTNNAYQRRLVYQEVRRYWPTELNARGQAGHIHITKITVKELEMQQQQRQSDLQRDIESSRGFREVIDILSACNKPIVGHNIVVDLAYILAQFVGPLPPTVEGYKKMIHKTFPTVMDTKYVSYTANALKGLAFDSSLGGLENMVGTIDFMGCPRIIPHYRHQRYLSRDLAHEAGYDAYITGSIMIRMLALIAKNEAPVPAPLSKLEIEIRKNGQNEKRPHYSKDSKASKTPKKNAEPKKASPPPLASVAVPAPAPVPAAPKKFSYADIVHRQRASATVPAPAAVLPTPVPPAPVVEEEEKEEEMEESESSESDYDYIQESDFPLHEKPFSWQSPSVTTLQNVLHWGRSSHGCINLVSS